MDTLSKKYAFTAVYNSYIRTRHNVNHVLLWFFMPTCYYNNDHHWEPNTRRKTFMCMKGRKKIYKNFFAVSLPPHVFKDSFLKSIVPFGILMYRVTYSRSDKNQNDSSSDHRMCNICIYHSKFQRNVVCRRISLSFKCENNQNYCALFINKRKSKLNKENIFNPISRRSSHNLR